MNYAGGGERFLAALIDGLIIGGVLGVIYIIGAVVTIPILLSTGSISTESAAPNDVNPMAVGGIFLVYMIIYAIILAFLVWYYIFYQAKKGQTVGKMVMHIKVVTDQGTVPSKGTFFLREFIGKWVSQVVLYIGYLMILWDPRKQGLHDKIASTFVVKV